jgi:hydrogenase-4 component F
MHAWLPDAHSEAPSPVSAMLSAVLLNCALLVVIRFSTILNQGIGPEFTQKLFLIFGGLSVIASSLFMYVQRDIKRLLAYSSVENIGLIVLGFGIGSSLGILAALLQAINHSLVKSLMFCTSGNILMKYHTRDLRKVKGMLQAAPFTSLLLMVGALALVGSPPFNIFISKFSIISAGIDTGWIWLMVVCVLFLAIVFAAFLRVISSSIFGEMPENVTKGEIKVTILAPVAVLMFLVLMFGLYLPPQVLDLLTQATQGLIVYPTVAGTPDLFLGTNTSTLPVGLLQVGHFLVP